MSLVDFDVYLNLVNQYPSTTLVQGEPGRQLICAEPELKVLPVETDDLFAIIGCDGVWDVLTDQQAVVRCRLFISRKLKPRHYLYCVCCRRL